jgi:hypothetical protein
MIGENRQLVTNEPVEFENNRLKLKIGGKLPIILEDFIERYPILIKENRGMSTCNRLDLQTLGGSQPIMPSNLRGHWALACQISLQPFLVQWLLKGQAHRRLHRCRQLGLSGA